MPRPPAHLDSALTAALKRLLRPAERSLLLAVSGGSDSVALLAGCARVGPSLGLRLEVAWIDHGLRPDVAHEGALVAGQAAARGLPFHARSLGLAAGPGIEARARIAREAALESIREAQGLAVIATGHTASDQAETLLMRLSRGASLRGAAGILARKGRLVRPLLELTREELRSALQSEGLPFVEDPMNADPAYLRVRVRREVLPSLEAAAGPGVASRLARFARWAAEDEAHLEAEAVLAFDRLTLAPGALDAVGLRALPPALRRRVLARLAEPRAGALSAVRLEAALHALEVGGRSELGAGWQLACAGGQVRLAPRVCAPSPEAALLQEALLELSKPSSEVTWDDGRWRLGWSRGATAPKARLRQALTGAQVDAAAGLVVRGRRTGDRVLLADGHTKAVTDLQVDARIPRELRARWPVVVGADGRVLWVPGAMRGRVEPAAGWLWAESPTDERGE